MAYRIAAHFYASNDQFGEGYVIISDNSEMDTRIEVGKKVTIAEAENESGVENDVRKLSEHCQDCKEEFGHPDNCIECDRKKE